MAWEKEYGAIDELPTNVFIRPLKPGEEVLVSVATGKDFYIRLAHIDNYNEDLGTRNVTLEVNGEKWFIRTPDTLTPELMAGSGGGAVKVRREKSDPTNKGSIGCPMPGVLVDSYVEVGQEVEEGQTLFKLSAMKMETEIKSTITGVVKRVLVEAGDNVEGDDLLAEIE